MNMANSARSFPGDLTVLSAFAMLKEVEFCQFLEVFPVKHQNKQSAFVFLGCCLVYAAITGKSYAEIEAEFAGKGYGVFKPTVGEAVVEMLRPIQEETRRILADKAYLESVYRAGAEKASYIASKTLRKVYKKIGFVAR